MIVAFPFAFGGEAPGLFAELALVFVRNVKGAKVVQMSDEKTPEVPGVDGCIRRHNSGLARWYFESMASFPAPEFLRLDVDVLMRGSPEEVFEGSYDVAIAKERKGCMNNGVVFVKNRAFFRRCRDVHEERTSGDNWNDIQVATQMVIDAGEFRVKKLDPEVYNKMPDRPMDYANAKLVHFEGHNRKLWMLNG